MKKVLFFVLFLVTGCYTSFYYFGNGSIEHYDNLELGRPGPADRVIDRRGYALGYSEKFKQPLWVTYRLTASEVTNICIHRTNDFRPDPLTRRDVVTEDYWNSGYDRGHLAPAADMHWSTNAMSESFFMSNMSPQTPDCNRRTWMYAETFARECAVNEGSVFIVSGPIVTNENPKTIGRNQVTVPDAFYKVIYDETPPEKMLAFVIPNYKPDANMWLYVTNVIYVEELTGLRFFPGLKIDKVQELKLHCNTNEWIYSK